MLEVKRKPASPSRGHAPGAPALNWTRYHGNSVADTQPAGASHDGMVARPWPAVGPPSTVESRVFQTKLPVITGEVQFKGSLSVDGLFSGQLGSACCLTVKQRCTADSEPELTGDVSFRDGSHQRSHCPHCALEKGTLIVDTGARVEADIDVAVAVINGTVKGDIVARERVELTNLQNLRQYLDAIDCDQEWRDL